MKKGLVLFLLLSLSLTVYGQQSLATSEDEANSLKRVTVKADVGFGLYPGMMGILSYFDVPGSFAMTSGLTASADVLYNFNKTISAGIHASFLPVYHYQDASFSTAINLLPIIAQLQFNLGKVFYITAGGGPGLLHGSGSTTSANTSFIDLITGENTGKTFDVWRGPYFILSYSLGGKFNLSDENRFGIDLNLHFYHVFGHPGLDSYGALVEQYAKIPAFLIKFLANLSLGVYFNF